MKIILPPSETKVSGGTASSLSIEELSFPRLTHLRKQVLEAVTVLAEDHPESLRVLKLGPKQGSEVQRNRDLLTSPTMPAIERYTGVLFDAIGVSTLSPQQRQFLDSHVLIQSALFGIITANDHIPAYRLSHNSSVFGRGRPLKNLWRAESAKVFDDMEGMILDLRSGGYTTLAPLPRRDGVLSLTVVTRGSDGSLRALNHFNKRGKGEIVRSIVQLGEVFSQPQDLIAGLNGVGHEVSLLDPYTLQFITHRQ
ncbi:peroxide stress protein YaaA [Lysinibacter sp. HNR]|uniref:YaaA family protein n=1 Tax=Lysinibacter sp. HNR TaxID=3031408 RepID=UPI0024360A53|nr:peroxide stress protein YaaA [Lysinibacter sp. HNR]WGD36608.1 peroxide stress protein YaaA [Lysinibacter sp. HNR]